jgi:hypothetical protein
MNQMLTLPPIPQEPEPVQLAHHRAPTAFEQFGDPSPGQAAPPEAPQALCPVMCPKSVFHDVNLSDSPSIGKRQREFYVSFWITECQTGTESHTGAGAIPQLTGVCFVRGVEKLGGTDAALSRFANSEMVSARASRTDDGHYAPAAPIEAAKGHSAPTVNNLVGLYV